jgi:hypothetical protein
MEDDAHALTCRDETGKPGYTGASVGAGSVNYAYARDDCGGTGQRIGVALAGGCRCTALSGPIRRVSDATDSVHRACKRECDQAGEAGTKLGRCAKP